MAELDESQPHTGEDSCDTEQEQNYSDPAVPEVAGDVEHGDNMARLMLPGGAPSQSQSDQYHPDLSSINGECGGSEVQSPSDVSSMATSMTVSSTHTGFDADISPEELEEKARLIQQVLELQNTLDDLSQRVDGVKEENLKLKSENQVLGQYIENLMSASSVFQSTSPTVKKNAGLEPVVAVSAAGRVAQQQQQQRAVPAGIMGGDDDDYAAAGLAIPPSPDDECSGTGAPGRGRTAAAANWLAQTFWSGKKK